jgi:arabinan endo-1,5-alpha-L-arabinosidase
MRDTLFSVGEFKRIYDPSVGEAEPWYVNDHTLARDHDGTWHLIGITHRQLDIPALERFFTAERSITADAITALNRELRESAAAAKRAGRPWFDAHAEKQLAHATAPSLTTPQWRKRPFALSTDATESVLWAPHVVTHDGLHYMYYAAGSAQGDGNFRMHLATSADMNEWTRHAGNPLFVDGYEARDPMVLRVGAQWVMYYTATDPPAGGNHVVACRTSTDLVSWTARNLAFVDPTQGTGAGTTESPFVVQRGDWYYLFLSMRHNYIPGYYADTEVFRSRDPLHWRIDDLVGRFDAHAAEVVRDVDGRWYVSHCGWYQGGVYLAPLTWHDGVDDAADERGTRLP